MKIKTTAIILSAVLLTACKENSSEALAQRTGQNTEITADEAAAKGFEKIETYGNFDIYYTAGSKTSVQLRGNSDDTNRVEIRCDGQKLVISSKKHFGSSDNIDVYVSSPRLSGISLNGSGDFKSESDITAENIDISISGSGDIEMRSLDCGECNANISGSGDIGIDRIKAGKLVAGVAGSGDIDLANANIKHAELTIAGSGDIDIDGHVGSCSKNVSGSGRIDINP